MRDEEIELKSPLFGLASEPSDCEFQIGAEIPTWTAMDRHLHDPRTSETDASGPLLAPVPARDEAVCGQSGVCGTASGTLCAAVEDVASPVRKRQAMRDEEIELKSPLFGLASEPSDCEFQIGAEIPTWTAMDRHLHDPRTSETDASGPWPAPVPAIRTVKPTETSTIIGFGLTPSFPLDVLSCDRVPRCCPSGEATATDSEQVPARTSDAECVSDRLSQASHAETQAPRTPFLLRIPSRQQAAENGRRRREAEASARERAAAHHQPMMDADLQISWTASESIQVLPKEDAGEIPKLTAASMENHPSVRPQHTNRVAPLRRKLVLAFTANAAMRRYAD